MILFRNSMIFLQFTVLFVLFNPFLVLPMNLPIDTYAVQRVLEWILIALAFLHLAVDQAVRQRGFAFLQSLCGYKKALLGLILILGLISSLHAAYPLYALLELTTFYGLFLTVLLFVGLFSLDHEVYLQYFYAFILVTFGVSCASALLMLLYDVSSPAFQHMGGDPYTMLASPGYMNRRFYDDVACMVLPILTFLAYRHQDHKIRLNWIVFFMLAYLYTRGIVSHSRIYVFEPLAILMCFPFLYRRKALPFLVVQCGAIVLGVLLYLLLYMHHGVTPASFPDRTFLNNRVLLWQIAGGLIAHHPLLGVGPLHFNFYARPLENYAAHPHSALMVIAAEWGLPVALAWIMLIGAGIIACIDRRATMPLPLLGSLIGVFLMMQVDGLILMPAGQSMLCLIAAWACAASTQPALPIVEQALARTLTPFLLISGLIALILMLAIGVPLLLHLDTIELNFMGQCQGNCMLSPDYWSEGFIQFY